MDDFKRDGGKLVNDNSKSVFVSHINSVTGKFEWNLKDEGYDYKQEIARSAYADMLHDTERNVLYEQGLKLAIQAKHAASKRAVVLDIGTGTGLLSMMAVRHGADAVYACDAFAPAVQCASRIIAANGMADRIMLIEKRSTELVVSEDLPERASILVTEVFDTELIGEGAIGTFSHALENLLTPDCIVVPSSARLYVQPVESAFLSTYNRLSIILPTDLPGVRLPPNLEFCNSGLAAPLLDLQLSELPALNPENPSTNEGDDADGYIPLAAPIEVFQFDFCGRMPLHRSRSTFSSVTPLRSGLCQAFLMWWDLSMDMSGDVVLSCRPHQACLGEVYEPPQWRDHWMQAVYFPPEPRPLEVGHEYLIKAEHDEYSLCFDVALADTGSNPDEIGSATSRSATSRSDLALQMAFCRLRLSMGQESSPYRRALSSLSRTINSAHDGHMSNDAVGDTSSLDGATVLCVSDGSFLPFLAARLNALRVLVVESNSSTRQVMKQTVKYNSEPLAKSLSEPPAEPPTEFPEPSGKQRLTKSLCDLIFLYESLDKIPEEMKQQISLIVGEPYFHMSALPWHDLHFWYSAASMRESLQSRPHVLPCAGRFYCLAVEFENLHRIRSPLINKQGFDMRLYDDMIEEARQCADDFTEMHSLWEYPGLALSEKIELCRFDFAKSPKEFGDQSESIKLPIIRQGQLNGVAFWMEYDLSSSTSDQISYGLVRIDPITHKPAWNKYHKQGVHLPAHSHTVSPETPVSMDLTFDYRTANISLNLRA